jgi:hypothetical protein
LLKALYPEYNYYRGTNIPGVFQAASTVPNDGSVVIQTYRREKPGRKNSTLAAEVQDVKKSGFLETSTSFEDREIYDSDSRMK